MCAVHIGKAFVLYHMRSVHKCRDYIPCLLKGGIDDVLLLPYKLLALFEAITLALDVDDSGVMGYSVEDSQSNGDVGEDLVPLRESLVGGKNSGSRAFE